MPLVRLHADTSSPTIRAPSPARLRQSRRRRRQRAPSRERVVVTTERRRPRRACADRAVDTRARRFVRAVCRVTSPRLLLSSSHRRLGFVRAEVGDAERAPSRERVVVPTERRRPRRACAVRAADARARHRVRRRASSDITALSFCCSLCHRPSSVIFREPTLATPFERRAASELTLSMCRASLLHHLSP